jgi:DNA polymerase-3 subunit epsilon
MRFADIRKAGWDTETTGPDPTTARIVTAAFVARGGGRPDRTQTWLINPGVPIPDEAAAVHGITTEKAQADGQDPASALDEIAVRLADAIGWGMPLVAFNQSFDWTVLHHDLVRNGLPTLADRLDGDPITLIDPHVIDKQVDRYVKGSGMRKLKPTCERYSIELTDWHTAEADALAALLIAEAQFDIYSSLNNFAPEGLYAAQQQWRAEQQAGLQEHFRKTNPDVVCEQAWPLIGATPGVTV